MITIKTIERKAIGKLTVCLKPSIDEKTKLKNELKKSTQTFRCSRNEALINVINFSNAQNGIIHKIYWNGKLIEFKHLKQTHRKVA